MVGVTGSIPVVSTIFSLKFNAKSKRRGRLRLLYVCNSGIRMYALRVPVIVFLPAKYNLNLHG